MGTKQAQKEIAEWNEFVWNSVHMKNALDLIEQGRGELITGKGWGLLALDNAKMRLRAAVEMIERMEQTALPMSLILKSKLEADREVGETEARTEV